MSEETMNEFKGQILNNAVLAFTAYGLDTGSDDNVQKVINETFTLEEVKCARTALWDMCHDGYLPAIKNRQTSGRRSEQQAIVGDIVEWLTTLTDLDKRPCLVVDVPGLVRIPKFQIEEINEVSMCDKINRLESRISGMNSMILQHIVDSDNAMSKVNTSLIQHTVDISNLKEKNGIQLTKPDGTKAKKKAANNGEQSVRRINGGGLTSHMSSFDTTSKSPGNIVKVNITESTNNEESNHLMGDDGINYELPLMVKLPPLNTSNDIKTTSSTVVEGPTIEETEPSVIKVKTFSDVLANNKQDGFKLASRKSRVVYGKSSSGVLKAASESLFDACISGVDCAYTENDLADFLKGHNIVFNSVKCYSKDDSLSKTFKVTLPPRQYKRLFNPSLWDTGICVKRFFSQKKP